MVIEPDCIPCIFRMAVSGLRELDADSATTRELCGKIASLPAMAGKSWDVTSPRVIEQVMVLFNEALGDEDPFRRVKENQNRAMLRLSPALKEDLSRASDPLGLALHLAVLGNTIDLMLANRPADLETAIRGKLETPLPENIGRGFKDRLEAAGRIVYLADNCGEIVLDALLLKEILRRHDARITLVVRSVPAMNDVTLKEAATVGIPSGVRVVENGMNGPYPGTCLERCSPEVREIVTGADLIISKGGGNFDSLSEEDPSVTGKTLFILLSKCRPYCDFFGASMLEPVIAQGLKSKRAPSHAPV